METKEETPTIKEVLLSLDAIVEKNIVARVRPVDAVKIVNAIEEVVARWIPVEERLPETGTIVLVYVGDPTGVEVMCDAEYLGSGFEHPWVTCLGEDGDMLFSHEVTHWMPRPPVPAGVKS